MPLQQSHAEVIPRQKSAIVGGGLARNASTQAAVHVCGKLQRRLGVPVSTDLLPVQRGDLRCVGFSKAKFSSIVYRSCGGATFVRVSRGSWSLS